MSEISVDLVPKLRLNAPFLPSFGWPIPNARWPSPEKTERIKSLGIDATAKKPDKWRRCYNRCEKELMKNIDADGGCRKKCHRIMKRVREQFWTNTEGRGISSYMLKVHVHDYA